MYIKIVIIELDLVGNADGQNQTFVIGRGARKSDGVYIAIGSVDAGGFIRSSPGNAAASPGRGRAIYGVQSAGSWSCRVNKSRCVNKTRETERSQGEKYSRLQVKSSGPAQAIGSVSGHRKTLLLS